MGQGRVEYTKSDDNHLIEYLAEHCPEERGRQGPALYKRLTDDTRERPWAKRHSQQSWLQRYRDHKAYFDNKIYAFLKKRALEKGEDPPSKPVPKDQNASPTKSQRAPFTDQEDKRLIQYLARAAPTEQGRHGDNIYKALIQQPDAYPWAKTHPWPSWQNRYKKSTSWFNTMIQKYQKAKGIGPGNTTRTLHKRTIATKDRGTEQHIASSSKLPEQAKQPVHEDGDEGETGTKRKTVHNNANQPPQKKRRIEEPVRKAPAPSSRPGTQLASSKNPPPEIRALRREEEEESQPRNPAPEKLPPKKVGPEPAPTKARKVVRSSQQSVPPPPPDDDYSHAIDRSIKGSDDESGEEDNEEGQLFDDTTRVVEPEPKKLEKRSQSLEYADPVQDGDDEIRQPKQVSIPPPDPEHCSNPASADASAENDISGNYAATSTPQRPPRTIAPPRWRNPVNDILGRINYFYIELSKEEEEQRKAKASRALTPPASSKGHRSATPAEQEPEPEPEPEPDAQVEQEHEQEQKPESENDLAVPVTPTPKVRRKRRPPPAEDEDWFASSPSRQPSSSPTPQKRHRRDDSDHIEQTPRSPPSTKRKPPVLVQGPFNSAISDERGSSVFEGGVRRRSGVGRLDYGLDSDEEKAEGSPKAKEDAKAWPPKRRKKGEEKATEQPALSQMSHIDERVHERGSPTPDPSHSHSHAQEGYDANQPSREREEHLPPSDDEQVEESDGSESQNAVERALFAASQTRSQEESVSNGGDIAASQTQPAQTGGVLAGKSTPPRNAQRPRGEVIIPKITPSQGQRFIGMINNALSFIVDGTSAQNHELTRQERPPSPEALTSTSYRNTSSPERPVRHSSMASTIVLPYPEQDPPEPSGSKVNGKKRAFAASPASARHRRADRRHTMAGFAALQSTPQPRDLLRSRISMPTPFKITPRTSGGSSSSSSTRSIPTFEGIPVEDRDFKVAMDNVLETIASNHRFHPDVAHEMWKVTGNLKATDEALRKMREAAQSIGESFVEEYQDKSMGSGSEYVPLEGTRAAAARSSVGGFTSS